MQEQQERRQQKRDPHSRPLRTWGSKTLLSIQTFSLPCCSSFSKTQTLSLSKNGREREL